MTNPANSPIDPVAAALANLDAAGFSFHEVDACTFDHCAVCSVEPIRPAA